MDQDGTWHGGGPRSRPHCARWGLSPLPKNGGTAPQFSAHFSCGQTAGCIKMPLDPGHIVLDGDPAPPKRGTAPPLFGPCLLWPNGWMDRDATWYEGRPRAGQQCVRCGPSSNPKKHSTPLFSAHVSCGHNHPSHLLLSSCLHSSAFYPTPRLL